MNTQDWIVRERRDSSGALLDCFVAAPAANGMAYGLEVLGDDYTGYGDVEGKLAHCKMIVELVNANLHLTQPAKQKELSDADIFKVRDAIKWGDGWDGDQWDLALARAIIAKDRG